MKPLKRKLEIKSKTMANLSEKNLASIKGGTEDSVCGPCPDTDTCAETDTCEGGPRTYDCPTGNQLCLHTENDPGNPACQGNTGASAAGPCDDTCVHC